MIHTLSKLVENPFTIGAASIGGIQLLSTLPIQELGQLVIQVAIGIATIIKLLRKKKTEPTEQKGE